MAAFVAKQMVGNKLNAVKVPAATERNMCTRHDRILFKFYIENILSSTLLLDEDLQALLTCYDFDIYYVEADRFTSQHQIIASTLSIFTSAILARRYFKTALCLSGLAVPSLVYQVWSLSKKNRIRNNIVILIRNISSLRKLNTSIIRYLKLRNDINSFKEEAYFSPYNLVIKNFLENHFEYHCKIYKVIKDSFEHFAQFLDEVYFEEIKYYDDVEIRFGLTATSGIEDCLELVQKLDDLLILLVSKVLSYVGLSFCSVNYNSYNTDYICHQFVPNFIQIAHNANVDVKKEFNQVCNAPRDLQNQLTQIKDSNNKYVTGKLHRALVCSISNIGIISEKSQFILNTLERSEDKDLEHAMLDLRSHTLATYESLDVLCKLYGIITNQTTAKESEIKITKPLSSEQDKQMITINFDDKEEELLEDQKFELYVSDDESENGTDGLAAGAKNSYHEESNAYLNLMVQELKQSIKQHQRFIAARKRRGSEDDNDNINSNSFQEKAKSPLRFNFQQVNNAISAPPEVPLLPFEGGNKMSFLDSIRTISSQRQMDEDVFGDAGSDSSTS